MRGGSSGAHRYTNKPNAAVPRPPSLQDPLAQALEVSSPWAAKWHASSSADEVHPSWHEAIRAIQALRALPQSQPRSRELFSDLFSLDRIRRVCKSFKQNTPLGSDALDFKRVAQLPDVALEELRSVLIAISLLRAPPLQVFLILLSSIPKKLGGVRWIAVQSGDFRYLGCLSLS